MSSTRMNHERPNLAHEDGDHPNRHFNYFRITFLHGRAMPSTAVSTTQRF